VKKKIQFNSEGITLVGNLCAPQNFDPSKKYYAIVTGGSLTSVKEQMAGTYAEKLAENGFIALAFDYRNYGESDGQPRQFEDPALKLIDLESAVTYLLSLPYVQAVAALGVCTSGGNVAYLAAADERIKAAVIVAAHLADASILDALYGSMGKNVAVLRKAGAEAKKQYQLTGENKMIPAYSIDDPNASHVGSFLEYYHNPNRGGGVKEWKNQFAVMGWETWLDFDPVNKAPNISIPFMVIHSDKCALPGNARKFYDNLKGKKELVWDDYDHTDHYDQPDAVNLAIGKATEFFLRNLN